MTTLENNLKLQAELSRIISTSPSLVERINAGEKRAQLRTAAARMMGGVK